MFIDEFCHDLMGAQHRTPTPKSTHKSGLNETRLQNEAMVLLPERPQGATSNNRCVVCCEKYHNAKRAQPEARELRLIKAPQNCALVQIR